MGEILRVLAGIAAVGVMGLIGVLVVRKITRASIKKESEKRTKVLSDKYSRVSDDFKARVNEIIKNNETISVDDLDKMDNPIEDITDQSADFKIRKNKNAVAVNISILHEGVEKDNFTISGDEIDDDIHVGDIITL